MPSSTAARCRISSTARKRTLGTGPGARCADICWRIAEIRDGQCVNRATGRVIRAIVPMHAFGHPVDIEARTRRRADFHLRVVEDAAESLGSTVHGRHTGTFGSMGTLSFNGNKTVTTGGGGAIITNDRGAREARQTSDHDGQSAAPLGVSARRSRLQLPPAEYQRGALGCAQLEQLPRFPRGEAPIVRALPQRLGADCGRAPRWRSRRDAAATIGCRRCCSIHAAAHQRDSILDGDQRCGFHDPADVDPDASIGAVPSLPADAAARRRIPRGAA